MSGFFLVQFLEDLAGFFDVLFVVKINGSLQALFPIVLRAGGGHGERASGQQDGRSRKNL
jgi:hypothetical protein